MKGIAYKTELDVDGPLLLDRNSMEDLNNLIERGFEKISRMADENFEKKVEDRFQRFYSSSKDWDSTKIEENKKEIKKELFFDFRKYKEITVKLQEGKYFSPETIKDCITAPELSRDNVRSLNIKYGAADIGVTIDLGSSLYTCLSIRTFPESKDLSREIFVELRDWVYKNQAPLWQRLWRKIKGFHWILFLFIIVISSSIIQTPQDIASKTYKSEAHQLLSKGITEQTLPKAIDLILKIQSEYVPGIQKEKSIPKWYGRLILSSLLISIILSFLPTFIIGIGKGGSKIKYWKGWLRIISVILPGLIFTSILWPKIIDIFKTIFRA